MFHFVYGVRKTDSRSLFNTLEPPKTTEGSKILYSVREQRTKGPDKYRRNKMVKNSKQRP